MNTNQLWRDGTLRETRLVVNGLPDAGEVGLPDEVFLGPQGDRVQMIRKRVHGAIGEDRWQVTDNADFDEKYVFDTFEDAFAHALALVREAVE